MSKKVTKPGKKYTWKQLRKLDAEIRLLAHKLRHTPILDPDIARKIADDLRAQARDQRVKDRNPQRLRGYGLSSSSIYHTARVVRGAPVPR